AGALGASRGGVGRARRDVHEFRGPRPAVPPGRCSARPGPGRVGNARSGPDGPRRRPHGHAGRALVPRAGRGRARLRRPQLPGDRRQRPHAHPRRPGARMIADLGIAFGRVAFVMLFVLNLGGLLTWVERKQSAIMQDRIGANRASIFGFRLIGLLHPLADAIKMLTKEDFRPARADRVLFPLAPFVSVFFALVAFASIPFGDTLHLAGREIPLQAVTLNVGILYVFAMLSLGVYGVMMAGWSSAKHYALLRRHPRAAALMISAEIAIGTSIMGVIMVYGSLNMQDIVRGQGQYFLGGWVPAWGIVTQPLAFVLFLTAGIAATKRIPFDTPEGESEII